jgi:hypothetical protein
MAKHLRYLIFVEKYPIVLALMSLKSSTKIKMYYTTAAKKIRTSLVSL